MKYLLFLFWFLAIDILSANTQTWVPSEHKFIGGPGLEVGYSQYQFGYLQTSFLWNRYHLRGCIVDGIDHTFKFSMSWNAVQNVLRPSIGLNKRLFEIGLLGLTINGFYSKSSPTYTISPSIAINPFRNINVEYGRHFKINNSDGYGVNLNYFALSYSFNFF